MMESIKFGEGSFSIIPLMNLLEEHQTFKLICDNWQLFGFNLYLNKVEVDGLKRNVTSGERNIPGILRDILQLWRDNHDEHANLQVLYDALMDIKVEDLADAVQERFYRCWETDEVDSPPMSPMRMGFGTWESSEDEVEAANTVTSSNEGGDLQICGADYFEEEYISLVDAIKDGQSVACIKKILDAQARDNFMYEDFDEAAKEVIESLSYNQRMPEEALAIFKLLMTKGFNLVKTLQQLIMECKNLNEELLRWFFDSGADFNSVVFDAIFFQQSVGIIRKILDFGGNPKHVNSSGRNALHVSAICAHESALEMFLKYLDVNAKDNSNRTPLHYMFSMDDKKYQNCLETLLRKGADFGAKCKKGYVPMVCWIKENCVGVLPVNPFPTLNNIKSTLPITEEIASTTLTAIVKETSMNSDFFPPFQEFENFVAFLIQEKHAKLQLKNENTWKRKKWRRMDEIFSDPRFHARLKSTGRINWIGEPIHVKASGLGKLEVQTKCSKVNVPIENVIISLLLPFMYIEKFMELCYNLWEFCDSDGFAGSEMEPVSLVDA